MRAGYDCSFLRLRKDNKDLGCACFNIDHTIQTEFRAYIKHISVTDMGLFQDAVVEVCNYIWKHLGADTIRIDLFHYPHGEKIQACVAIKDALSMQRKGFKWKTLINDPETGSRF